MQTAVMRRTVIGMLPKMIKSSVGVRSIPNGRSDIASLLLLIHEEKNMRSIVITVEQDTITLIAKIFPA